MEKRNEFIVWLTAVCGGLALLLSIEKKLSVMILFWYFTVLSFIFISIPYIWWFILTVDLIVYYIFIAPDALDPFGEIKMEHLFVTVVKQRVEHQKMIREMREEATKNRLRKQSVRYRQDLAAREEISHLGGGFKGKLKRTYYDFTKWMKSLRKNVNHQQM